MTPEVFIKAKIADFAYQEASHFGSVNQMLAVACVIRNRVKAGWQGGDWIEVLAHAREVSAIEAMAPRPYAMSDPNFRQLLVAVEEIFYGTFRDTLTGGGVLKATDPGGLYYMDSLYPDRGANLRPWFKSKILDDQTNHPRIAQVGMLYIFR